MLIAYVQHGHQCRECIPCALTSVKGTCWSLSACKALQQEKGIPFQAWRMISTVFWDTSAQFWLWIAGKQAQALGKNTKLVRKGASLQMCYSQCLLQVSSEKHEHFFRLEGRDKSRSRLHWAQNTAYHDFSGDFRSISSVWLDGSAKRLGDGSIQSWLPKFKVAMHRSTRSQSTCGTVFDQKKGILMLFWIFIHEKVQLTCPYGYHLWPEV